MKKFLLAMMSSLGFIPIFFAFLIIGSYLLGWDFVFGGQTVYPNPFFALLLFLFGLFWTLRFQHRTK